MRSAPSISEARRWSSIRPIVAGFRAQVSGEPFWFEWATVAAVLLLPIAAAEARRSNLRRRAEAVERQVAERLQAERLLIAYDRSSSPSTS
jgi:hypothetical protein